MIFYRSVWKQLEAWKVSSYRKPLVVRGARQTGKTTLIKEFGKTFDTFICLNLELAADRKMFTEDLPVEQLLQRICLEKNIVHTGKTLLFLDEIQQSPEAVAILRYFYEKLPDLFVISAGSLLEVLMDSKSISFPVGRVEYLYLFPLSFKEYLLALGDKESENLLSQVPYPQWAHEHLTTMFRSYMATGGMPEVVARYVATKDLSLCAPVYASLFIAFQDDVAKYAKGNVELNIIRRVIEVAPSEVGNRIIFNKFGKTEYKSREVANSLRILERAMLLYLRYPVTGVKLPLQQEYNKSPRLQFLDTGMLCYSVGAQAALISDEKLDSVFDGMIAEHVVGQELMTTNAIQITKPLFWVRDNPQANAELDFICINGTEIMPIEVKAGKTGTLKSMHSFIERSGLDKAIRFYDGKVSVDTLKTTREAKEYRLLNLPLFVAQDVDAYWDHYFKS